MLLFGCQDQGVSLHQFLDSLPLCRIFYSRQQFLKNNAWHYHPLPFSSQLLKKPYDPGHDPFGPAASAERQGPNRGVDNNQRAFRIFL